jgi:adenylosuccinate synthase
MHSPQPTNRHAPNKLVYLLLAVGSTGTGVGYVRADNAQHEAERYQDQLQHCQERESDRMWQILHPVGKP